MMLSGASKQMKLYNLLCSHEFLGSLIKYAMDIDSSSSEKSMVRSREQMPDTTEEHLLSRPDELTDTSMSMSESSRDSSSSSKENRPPRYIKAPSNAVFEPPSMIENEKNTQTGDVSAKQDDQPKRLAYEVPQMFESEPNHELGPQLVVLKVHPADASGSSWDVNLVVLRSRQQIGQIQPRGEMWWHHWGKKWLHSSDTPETVSPKVKNVSESLKLTCIGRYY